MAAATGWNAVKCEPDCDVMHIWLFSGSVGLHLDCTPDIALEIGRMSPGEATGIVKKMTAMLTDREESMTNSEERRIPRAHFVQIVVADRVLYALDSLGDIWTISTESLFADPPPWTRVDQPRRRENDGEGSQSLADFSHWEIA
jgi:hypothetical protein